MLYYVFFKLKILLPTLDIHQTQNVQNLIIFPYVILKNIRLANFRSFCGLIGDHTVVGANMGTEKNQ